MLLLRILTFLITLGISACENSSVEHFDDWNGSDAEFRSSFRLKSTAELNNSAVLVNNDSGEPYTGVLHRKDDTKLTEQNYVNGLLNGKSIKSSSDGSWVEANYANGKLHGEMKLFDSAGKLRSVMHYQNGIRVISEID
jgi:hypothetical protein